MRRIVKLTVTVIAVSFLLNFMCAAAELTAPVDIIDYAGLFTEGVYGEISLPYRLYVPEGAASGGGYPVILFLHGAGARGTDNLIQLYDGPFPYIFADPELYENVILLAPQCPEDGQWVNQPWSVGVYSVDETPESVYLSSAVALLDEVAEQYGGDRSRLYITGLSMGGYGVWDALARYPGVFAAAVPICGGADASMASVFAEIPVRTFHCTGDQVVPFAGTATVVEAVRAAGGDIEFTEIDSGAHDAWTTAYSGHELYEWLFEQKRELSVDAVQTDPQTGTAELITSSGDTTAEAEAGNERDAASESGDGEDGGLKSAGPTVAVIVFVVSFIVLGCVIYFRRDQFN